MSFTLAIDGLTIAYTGETGRTLAVRDLSLTVASGETYGLVGESGCGKSTAALAMLGYLPPNGRRLAGRLLLEGEDLMSASAQRLRALRGPGVAMVHQDPVGALNPVLTLGRQLLETLRAHRPASEQAMREQAIAMLGRVALPEPASFLGRYPHQASGGQLQRIVIAMALLARPRLLVLDEPTTGLDVTVEAEVARLVADLARDFDMAVVYISHNLGLIARVCQRIGVMYAGELVEQGAVDEVFERPQHPYTRGLIACLPRIAGGHTPARLATIPGRVPRLDQAPLGCAFAPRCPHVQPARCTGAGPIALAMAAGGSSVRCVRVGEIGQAMEQAPPRQPRIGDAAQRLSLRDVTKHYGRAGGLWARLMPDGVDPAMAAAAKVSFDVGQGEIVGLVGESGSGKSTLARIVAGLEQASAGKVLFHGIDIAGLRPRQRPAGVVSAVQIVFQNPDRTLNPAHRVARILARALRRSNRPDALPMARRVAALLERVSLPAETAGQWPHALSGGQRQRVAIARALAGDPELVLADEPVSALDVSVQGAIINLLLDVRDSSGAAMLFISHDLALVHAIADRVVVLRRGQVMETGPRNAVFTAPHHPYTRTLLAAVGAAPDLPPRPSPELPAGASLGCVHAAECRSLIGPVCWREAPPLRQAGPGHLIRCHRPLDELRDPVPAEHSHTEPVA
jgi:peptide/nickel transport system ATP-binding protein